MGKQIGRDSRKNQNDGIRRDGRDGSGRDRVAVEHPWLRHTLRAIPQSLRHYQQRPAAPVHRFREAQSGRPQTPTHRKLFFRPLRQVKNVTHYEIEKKFRLEPFRVCPICYCSELL